MLELNICLCQYESIDLEMMLFIIGSNIGTLRKLIKRTLSNGKDHDIPVMLFYIRFYSGNTWVQTLADRDRDELQFIYWPDRLQKVVSTS